ncbi:Glycerate dehydrogenase [Zhongshania aliphaticivorans]|uniref:Glycerate dehydrogenase n=1 Tax=Zhongshania aliphaticivorans TaxID=1470434 RepID=A0A5S9N688_9GAMM|nr:D-2-hydroxyacid dehydrogenase [Zhongshania aliphaticivorans]CAA0081218.1 Glycerate dehydrogenase [Zhongshania aliphaticivorans]CAA0085046.1 Glycerate dehydrogenase [Zhongshania aliphaticivorans]
MHGVFLDTDSFSPSDIHWQGLKDSIESSEIYAHTLATETAARIANADIIFTNKVHINRDHFAHAKNLKLIVVLATGTNNIDLVAAAEHKVTVCNNIAYSTTALVEHSAMLMLALMRQLSSYHHSVQQGKWQQHDQFCMLNPPIRELRGKTLGIIGYGASGKGVADFGRAMGMNILAWQSCRSQASHQQPPRLPLTELLPQCDIVSIHCPLTSETKHLIDYAALTLMKPSAMLINTARGGIVHEHDLAHALNQGLLAGAAVDVLSEEPPRNGNPLLDCHHPNLIITPHNAWASCESRQVLIDQSIEIVKAFRAGKPINQV